MSSSNRYVSPPFIPPKRPDGSVNIDYLIEHYTDYHDADRTHAAQALAESGREDAIRFLIAHVDDPELRDDPYWNQHYGWSARVGLHHVPSSACELIMEAMRQKPRRFWLIILGECETERKDVFEFIASYVDDPAYTAAALRALYTTVFPEVVPIALPFLDNPAVGNIAIRVLHKAIRRHKTLGKLVVASLIHVLSNSDVPHPSWVVGLLGEIGDPRAIPALQSFSEDYTSKGHLSSEDKANLSVVKIALGNLQGTPTVPVQLDASLWGYEIQDEREEEQKELLGRAKRPDGSVDIDYLLAHYREFGGEYRDDAATLLGKSGREDAIRFLAANVGDKTGWGDEFTYGISAAVALKQAPASACDTLMQIMRENPSSTWISILGKIGIERRDVFEFLISYLDDPRFVSNIIHALIHNPFPEAIDVGLRYLDDPKLGPVALALLYHALEKHKDWRAVNPIIKMLDHPQGGVRMTAVHILADLGDPQAVPALQAYGERAILPSAKEVAEDAIAKLRGATS